MINVKTFITDEEIKDAKRTKLVKDTSTKLIESNLSNSKRIDIVMDALEKTSWFASNLSLTPFLIEQDKNLLLQDIRVASFILKTGFPLKEAPLIKTIKESLAKIKLSGSAFSNSDREIWEKLKYKGIKLMAADLSAELTQLCWDLGDQEPFYTPVIKAYSLTPDFFKLQIGEVENIVQKGWEEQIRANSRQNVVLTSTVIGIHELRGKSLINFYNTKCQASYEYDFASITGNKTINSRDQRCISDIIDESQLDSRLLFHRGLRSDANLHYEDWLKSDDVNW